MMGRPLIIGHQQRRPTQSFAPSLSLFPLRALFSWYIRVWLLYKAHIHERWNGIFFRAGRDGFAAAAQSQGNQKLITSNTTYELRLIPMDDFCRTRKTQNFSLVLSGYLIISGNRFGACYSYTASKT
jgi:hypothetical protein